MRLLSRGLSWIAWPLLLFAAAGCGKRDLDLGDGRIGIDGGGGGGSVGITDAAPTDGPPADLPPLRDGGPSMTPDGPAAGCGMNRIALPWTSSPSAPLHLGGAASSDAVAVMNRQGNMLDVRTYALDGTSVGGYQWQGDAQFLPYEDDRFLLVSRSTTDDFMMTSLGRDLKGGTRLDLANATATEHIVGVVGAPPSTYLLTDERFINFAAGGNVTWSAMLGTAGADAFKTGRIVGLAALSDRVLMAWSRQGALTLTTVDFTGHLIGQLTYDSVLDTSLPDTATAIPFDTGLLMFDDNPVRLTQIGSDLSRRVIGKNAMLGVFARTAPQVAAIVQHGKPTAFWLTVFPDSDTSQATASHQLWGCTFDLSDPSSCQSLWQVDPMTGLMGYGVAQDPVAAAALPGGGFAVAFTDAGGSSSLYVYDTSCMTGGAEP
jgi:hypothetical protein